MQLRTYHFLYQGDQQSVNRTYKTLLKDLERRNLDQKEAISRIIVPLSTAVELIDHIITSSFTMHELIYCNQRGISVIYITEKSAEPLLVIPSNILVRGGQGSCEVLVPNSVLCQKSWVQTTLPLQ